MSQTDQPTRGGEKPTEPSQRFVPSTTQRPRTTGSERPLPSSTSMPVDLNARSQSKATTGVRQHSQEQETAVNPLYQMSMSTSEDTGIKNQQTDIQDEPCLQDDTDKAEQEQEVKDDSDLKERILVKQISQEYLHREDFPRCPKVNCTEKIVSDCV